MYKYELVLRCTLIDEDYIENFSSLIEHICESHDFEDVTLVSMSAGMQNPDEECEGCPEGVDDL